jgi:hypothetical protein
VRAGAPVLVYCKVIVTVALGAIGPSTLYGLPVGVVAAVTPSALATVQPAFKESSTYAALLKAPGPLFFTVTV